MEKVDRIAHFLGHIAGGDDYLDDVDAICTRITELERERDALKAEIAALCAENERLKEKLSATRIHIPPLAPQAQMTIGRIPGDR